MKGKLQVFPFVTRLCSRAQHPSPERISGDSGSACAALAPSAIGKPNYDTTDGLVVLSGASGDSLSMVDC